MRAIRLHEFGPPENLRYEVVPDPLPGRSQVRVKVAAAGVHLIDTTLRAGQTMGPLPLPTLPAIPGREVAGEVDAVGEGVDTAWIGKRVVGHLGIASAGYAELAVGDVTAMHEIPEQLSAEEAVAMIGTGRTAIALLHIGQIAPSDTVVITAAAGGIGTLLVQAAKHVGATVIALSGSPEKMHLTKALGADHAFDYTQPDWPSDIRHLTGGQAATLVFDGIGGANGRRSFELLGTGGRMVMFGWSAGEATNFTSEDVLNKALTVTSPLGGPWIERLGGIRALETESLRRAATGELRAVVGQRFPLSDAAGAHRAVVGRGTRGKTVLVP